MDEKLAISPAPILMVEDLVNPKSPEDEDGGGFVEDLMVKSNDPNPTKMVVEDVNSTADPTKMVEDGNQEITDNQQVVDPDASMNSKAPTTTVEDGNLALIDNQQAVNSDASVNSVAPTTIVEGANQGPMDHEVVNSDTTITTSMGPASIESEKLVNSDASVSSDSNQGPVEQGGQVPNSSAPDPFTKKEEDERAEDVENTTVGDKDLFTPPFNVSVEERIAWFRERVPRMKVFESTKRTRVFDQRIKEFFKGCKVRFFMTWISPSRLFGKREMFCLESIFKAHPKGCVAIVSKSMDSKRGKDLLRPLTEGEYKVLPVAPDLSLLFSETPAGPWLEGLKAAQFDPGMIPITQNLSNLLRLVLLYKYGGIYLDVDVLVLKDVSGLKNCVGIQTVDEQARTWTSLNNAVMIFDQKHPLLLKLIQEFTTHFDGNIWGHNGPDMVSRVVMNLAFNDPAYEFNIMSPTAFYPVDWLRIPKYFRRPKNANETQWTYDEDFTLKQRSYAIHLWNHVSSRLRIEEHSLIARIISDHCILCKDIYDIEPTSTSSSTSS